jgi:hypothetical protein
MNQGTIIVTFPLLLLACGGARSSVDQRGVFTGRQYANDMLGFSFELSSEWDTVMGARYYNEPGWNTILDSSIAGREKLDNKFTHLIAVERANTSDTLYSAIGILTEELAVVGSAEEYFQYTQDLVESDSTLYPKWEFSDIRPQTTIGGKEFLMQAVFVWTSQDEKINRITYCREVGDKLLVFTITDFHSKAALGKAKDFLRTVKWTSSTGN